jgi:Fe2+ or Zn2+ uptake regulation protein
MERLTSQKLIILEYLKSVKSHPSAEDIHKNVKKVLPRISLGTVYRNLEKFSAQGKILEIKSGEIKRFDGDITDHQHFICSSCSKVYDIFCRVPQMKDFESHIHKIGKIESYQISFYGICRKCKKNK